MIDSKRILAQHRMGDPEQVILNWSALHRERAQAAIKNRNTPLTHSDCIECCGIVEDAMDFKPDPAAMYVFLTLHPILSSQITRFGAGDTEVRDELVTAVGQFALGLSDYTEHPEIHTMIAEQWKTIWQST